MTTRYIPHIIYATALTSLSIHLLNYRKNSAEERARYRAKETVLQSLITRLASGENVTDEEIERLKALADGGHIHFNARLKAQERRGEEHLGWKETLFGKKVPHGPASEKDDEIWTREVEEYLKSLENTSSKPVS